jgi:predicted DNA-binding protein (MmcQ/YjbR family)
MTPDEFRALALSLPDAEANAHLGNPDFRVKGKIFATMGGTTGRPVVKLTAEEQDLLFSVLPQIFAPVPGSWGQKGWTHLTLSAIDEATAKDALERSWRNVVQPPKRPRARKAAAGSETP